MFKSITGIPSEEDVLKPVVNERKKLESDCKKYVELRSNNKPNYSAADEIKKFKELLDMGAISQEEYDAKKKQLLGL